MEATAAGSGCTPKMSFSTRKLAACDPPPTAGAWAAEPTRVKAVTRAMLPKLKRREFPGERLSDANVGEYDQAPV
jgi:hypothetical protein